jgi:hypothetical protein
MADNLYDTGALKRVIVEHRHTVEVREVARRPEASWCDLDPRYQCIGGPHRLGEACSECPLAPKRPKSRVTITPEFQPVTEPKQLPPGKK